MKRKLKPICLKISDQMEAEVERIAEKRGMNKSEVYRMMIDLGIDCHKDMEKVGIVAAVDFTHFIRKSLKEKTVRMDKKNQLEPLTAS